MSEASHGERRYKVRRADGELEYVDHDELWRVQQEETERIHRERLGRRKRLALAAAAVLAVALAVALLLWGAGGREPEVGAAAGETSVAEPPQELTLPPAAAAEPAKTPEELAAAAVGAWAAAWRAQDVRAYLAGYSLAFRPADGSTRSAWQAVRRRRLEAPASIEVDLEGMEVVLLDAGRARARFRQSYRSPEYSDVVLKTLELVDEDGVWRIVRETAEPR